MSNINKYLEKILSARYGKDVRQAIHNSIKEVDSVADTAQNSASNSAKSALASETSAKASMEAAANSEALAEQYKNEAFAGTPEGYAALVNQVGLLDIATSTGTTLYNSKPGGYRLTELVGATVQNGEPSPDNPIAIENTFDCVEMIQGKWDTTTGNFASSSNLVSNKYPIPCKSGDVVKIVAENSLSRIFVMFYNENGYIRYDTNAINSNVYEYAPPSNGATHFKFSLYNENGLPLANIGKISLTINGKHVVQIVEHGEDELLNLSPKQGYLGDNGAVTSNSSWYYKELEIESGYYYTVINNDTNATYPRHCWFDSNKNFISAINYNGVKELLLTPPSNAKYLGVSYPKTTPASVYKTKVTTLFLSEPLRATDRLVRKDGVIYENHRRGSIILDGSKFSSSYGSTDDIGKYWTTQFDELLRSGDTTAICTHFKHGYNTTIKGTFYVSSGNSKVGFIVDKAQFPTIEDFKAWVDENTVISEYELAEETFTPLDTASQLALNDMETFDGVTYIEVDSKIPPTSISGEYGTSQVGAYTLKCMNDNDTDRVERAELKARLDELAVALVSQ